MQIAFVEIRNFRKLKSVRVEFSEETTLLVGANNSGKTSATLALGNFLERTDAFTTNDFTLSDWPEIEAIAEKWESNEANPPAPTLAPWEALLPSLDVWIEFGKNEVHHARALLPTLDWTGGKLGVRLRLEPKDVGEFYKDYLTSRKAAQQTTEADAKLKKDRTVKLWPQNVRRYLERKLNQQFQVRCYLLDPAALAEPVHGIAKPQKLPADIEAIEGNPLTALIRVNMINAQRGFSEEHREEGTDARGRSSGRPLSDQLRSYYIKHLNPEDAPEPEDMDALEAIEKSQLAFSDRLNTGFAAALKQLEDLNYPGIADPRLRIATNLRPEDLLDRKASVEYELGQAGSATGLLRLPEAHNGLGYQHLISIVFKLMAFRDAWMRVGKAAKSKVVEADKRSLQPLHLVIVEEPEAHLHPQVQQVFVKKAYGILRDHADLKADKRLRTQLVISTHSSHIAHESDFGSLRYFRRLAPSDGKVPVSAVINLSTVFGKETDKFVARYIRATHCDLFFADGAILVEGDAERILLPHFIRHRFTALNRCYISILQVGGSHAHRLRQLIEHLGLTTLVVTDVDTGEKDGHHKAARPARKLGQVTTNPTLKTWHPAKNTYDELLSVKDTEKIKEYPDHQFAIRVAYQVPVKVSLTDNDDATELLPATFEDALIFENASVLRNIKEPGKLAENVKEILETKEVTVKKAELIYDEVRATGGKAEFALDLLTTKERLSKITVPKYVDEGLSWLQTQLDVRQKDLLQRVKTGEDKPVPEKVVAEGAKA